MLRIASVSLSLSLLFVGVAFLGSNVGCTVTPIDDDETDGGEGEGEGEGQGNQGPEDNAEACSDGVDNDGDNFVDCDDFDCDNTSACVQVVEGDVTVQSIRDGTNGEGFQVTVEKVFITAKVVSGSGNTTFTVQEPQGAGTDDHVYPEFAGIAVFVQSAVAATLPAVADAAVGDCVTVSGSVDDFNGGAQLSFITAFTAAEDCGAAPEVTVVPLADIASTTAQEDQAGPKAEQYESVLVRVEGPLTVTAAANDFGDVAVTAADDGNTLLIGDTFVSPGLNVGDQLSSVTGVYTQFVAYTLNPRSADELVAVE